MRALIVRLCKRCVITLANVDQRITRSAGRTNEMAALIVNLWRQAFEVPACFAFDACPHGEILA